MRNSVDAVDPNQIGRSGQVTVPDVVMDELIVPDALAGASIERKKRVGKEVLPETIAAVEIVSSGSGRNVNDAALGVEAQARPGIGATRKLPRILGPRVISKFSRMRDRVETPHELAGPDIERTDVTRNSGQGFRRAVAENEKVFEDDAGRVRRQEKILCMVGQADMKVDGKNLLTVLPRHRVELVPRGIEDAVVPERHPAVHAGAEQAVLTSEGVEAPQFFTRSRIEREESETWRRPIESSVDDDGVALDLAAILGVAPPES